MNYFLKTLQILSELGVTILPNAGTFSYECNGKRFDGSYLSIEESAFQALIYFSVQEKLNNAMNYYGQSASKT